MINIDYTVLSCVVEHKRLISKQKNIIIIELIIHWMIVKIENWKNKEKILIEIKIFGDWSLIWLRKKRMTTFIICAAS